jgi:hypothetical protein
MHVVHLGRLKPPRTAAGHMHLLTVPSHDGADMRFRQDMQASLGISLLSWRPLTKALKPNDTSKADWSQLESTRNPWRHAEPASGRVGGEALVI